NVALAVNLLRRKRAEVEHLKNQVNGSGQVFIHHLGGNCHVFLGCPGVHVAANAIDLVAKLNSVQAVGALEQHMLNKVRKPAFGARLVSAAYINVKSKTGTAHIGYALQHNANTIVESKLPDALATQIDYTFSA